MKGSHLFWLSRLKGMTVGIWIRDYSPPRCFQKKISGRSKHNENHFFLTESEKPGISVTVIGIVESPDDVQLEANLEHLAVNSLPSELPGSYVSTQAVCA
jgi:hypothetical protein